MNVPVIIKTPPLGRLFRMAVVGGVEGAVRLHVERGDNLNARDASGLTPLMLSAARNHVNVCRLLLEAGADSTLLSPLGETALYIATAAGADRAADVIRLLESCKAASPGLAPEQVRTTERVGDTVSAVLREFTAENETGRASELMLRLDLSEPSSAVEEQFKFDLEGWEPEEEAIPPEADQLVLAVLRSVQNALTDFDVVDSSADWADVEVDLPIAAVPRVRPDVTDSNFRIQTLLLCAMHHGRVWQRDIEALSVGADGIPDPDMEAILSMAVNGVGAEITASEVDFEPSGQCDGSIGIEASTHDPLLDEALSFIEGNAARRADPLRYYQRDLQRQKLLTAEQEVALARTLESTMQSAINALAGWPQGLNLVLTAGRQVDAGARVPNSYSRRANENSPDLANVPSDEESDANGTKSQDCDNENDNQPFVSSASQADILDDRSALLRRSLDQLELQLSNKLSANLADASVSEILSSLRLNHQFLCELAEAASFEKSKDAIHFLSTFDTYRLAWEQMVLANIKLALNLSQKYLYSGEPLDDLTQEGNLGLFKAIERFDWRMGNKFSTYATWWIKQSVGRHVADKCRTIRIPAHVHADLQRMFWDVQALELESGHPPRLDQIAARTKMSPEKVALLQRLEQVPKSIDEVRPAELMSFGDTSGIGLPDPEDVIAEFQLGQVIDRVLSTLNPKEEQIIRLRFGIGVEEALTLEQAGSQFGVTRERARQIEAKALQKLRHASRIHDLSLVFRGTRAAVEDSPLPVAIRSAAKRSVDGDRFKNQETADRAFTSDLDETFVGEMAFPGGHPTPDLAQQLRLSPLHVFIPEQGVEMNGSFRHRRENGLAKLIAQAEALDVTVDDDRDGSTGRIWIRVPDSSDRRYRGLVRKILSAGFEAWPGKGYWK